MQATMDFASGQLSSLIDTTVKKMTLAVLRMQQDECRKKIQREIETEERKVLRGKLVDFIQEINKVSAGRETS
jgi:hypothetical protein